MKNKLLKGGIAALIATGLVFAGGTAANAADGRWITQGCSGTSTSAKMYAKSSVYTKFIVHSYNAHTGAYLGTSSRWGTSINVSTNYPVVRFAASITDGYFTTAYGYC